LQLQLKPFSRTKEIVSVNIESTLNSTTLTFDLRCVEYNDNLHESHNHELWRGTCFELFIADNLGTGYREFNFTPSGRYCSTKLSSYRESLGVHKSGVEPTITTIGKAIFSIVLKKVSVINREIALSMITADRELNREFWAVCHPFAQPDFHHRSNFFRFELG